MRKLCSFINKNHFRSYYKNFARMIENNPKKLMIEWSNGESSSFFPLWLRDHCECFKCFDKNTHSRKIDNKEVLSKSNDLKILNFLPLENSLKVVWEQNGNIHESEYNFEFLEKYSNEKKTENPMSLSNSKNSILWNSNLKKIPTISYDEMNSSEKGLFKAVKLIYDYGFIHIVDVPYHSHKPTRDLIEKIAYTRKSIYGDFWEFTDDGKIEDFAYTNIKLNSHTDGCYAYDPPGLQTFHCIEADYQGGESFLVDGFYVAEELRKRDPEAFQYLTKTKIPFKWISESQKVYFKNKTELIRVDEKDAVYMFRYNDIDRDTLDVKDPEMYYKSFYSLFSILHSPESEIRFTLKPGTLMITNNWRVTHGRNEFQGKRKIIGCYLNQEDFISIYLFLKNKNL